MSAFENFIKNVDLNQDQTQVTHVIIDSQYLYLDGVNDQFIQWERFIFQAAIGDNSESFLQEILKSDSLLSDKSPALDYLKKRFDATHPCMKIFYQLYIVEHHFLDKKSDKIYDEIKILWDLFKELYDAKINSSYYLEAIHILYRIVFIASNKKYSDILDGVVNFIDLDSFLFTKINLINNTDFYKKFSADQKEKMLFGLFEKMQKISVIDEVLFCKIFFGVVEKLQINDLKEKIANYIISEALNANLQGYHAMQIARIVYDVAGHCSDSKSAKNSLLNLVLASRDDVLKSMQTKVSYFDEKTSIKIENTIENNINIYENHRAYDAILDYSHQVFNQNFPNEESGIVGFMRSICSEYLVDNSGLIVCRVNSGEDSNIKRVSNIFSNMVQNFINPVIHAFEQKEDFKDLARNLKIFDNDLDRHVNSAFQDYLKEDWYGFVVKSVPLIERKLRDFLKQMGEADIRPNNMDGFDYRPMRAFLESDFVSKKLSAEAIMLFRVIYDDRRGLNFRNKIAHGIFEPNEINKFQAIIVLMTLVYLSALDFSNDQGDVCHS